MRVCLKDSGHSNILCGNYCHVLWGAPQSEETVCEKALKRKRAWSWKSLMGSHGYSMVSKEKCNKRKRQEKAGHFYEV